MTVICWDGQTLAADRLSAAGSMRRITRKIRRFPDGSIGGAAGPGSACEEIMEWYVRGAVPGEWPAHQRVENDAAWLVIIRPGGELLHWQTGPYPLRYEAAAPFAMGAGREFALTAMYLGKAAADAVEVACALCTDCGNGVDTLELEPC